MAKKELSKKHQLIINLSASFVSYGVTLLIGFFLSPFIVQTIGVEANGFVSLANNFVSYASLITLALNSLAGRYITISLVKGDIKEANRYFASVYYANIAIASALAIVGTLVIIFLEKLINIPANLVSDVRLLFICLLLNCLISVVGSVFSVATFARNKLYLESLRSIEANLARALIIVALFALFTPKVTYIGVGSLFSGLYVLVCNLLYTKRLLPEVKIQYNYFDIRAVVELSAAGVWNTVNRLGQILINDLDLLITNLFISATAMGVLSLSQTVPNMIGGLMSSIVGVYSPNFTILYAEGKYTELNTEVKQAMTIMGIMTDVPIIVLIVCGEDFFHLWQPTQNAATLQALSLLAVGILIVSGGLNCLYNIFTVVNKIKLNSIVVLVSGFATIGVVFLLLKFTDLGIFAVAGVSTAISIIRNIVFTAPYGAHCLQQKWYSFYPVIVKSVIYTSASALIGNLIVRRIVVTGWACLTVKSAIVCILSVVIAFLFFFSKDEQKIVMQSVQRLIRRRK